MHNIIEIRKHFRSLSSYSRPLVYWDSASTALKLDLITKVVEWFDSKMCANPGRANYFTAISVEGLSIITRMNILKNVSNSLSKQCVFYKSATEAINAMILSRENCVGNILACVSDHNSVIGPAFKTKRFILNTLDEDCIPSVRNYLSLLNESISLIVMTYRSHVLGSAIPANLYGYLRKGQVYLLDGSQDGTDMNINIDKTKCNAYVFSAHKHGAMTGVGVNICDNEILNKMHPSIVGGGNILNISLSLRSFTLAKLPYRHEAGTQMVYGPMCLNLVLEWRRRFISRCANYKFRYLWATMRTIKDIKFYNKYTPSTRTISFSVGQWDPALLSMFLSKFLICIRSGVMCAPLLMKELNRITVCRASLGLHNTFKDVDALVNVIRFLLKQSVADDNTHTS